MAIIFKPRGIYTFNVYPGPIIGEQFTNATVLSVMDFQTATRFADIKALHENVFPYLPEGSPNRPEDFDYLLISVGENTTVLGVPWIIAESVEERDSMKMSVTIEDVTAQDIMRVRECLSQNGYNKISLKLIGVNV
jgi:hypothetical protein